MLPIDWERTPRAAIVRALSKCNLNIGGISDLQKRDLIEQAEKILVSEQREHFIKNLEIERIQELQRVEGRRESKRFKRKSWY